MACTHGCDRTLEFRRFYQTRLQQSTAATAATTEAADSSLTDPTNQSHTITQLNSQPISILTPIKKLTPFTEAAIHLRNSIRSLHQLLSSQQSEYLDLHRLVAANSSLRSGHALTDTDRDALEQEVRLRTLQIATQIEALKKSIPTEEEWLAEQEEVDEDDDPKLTPEQREARKAAFRTHNNPDLRAHQHSIIMSLDAAVQSVQLLMANLQSQRTERLKRELEEKHPGTLKAYRARTAAKANGNDPTTTDDSTTPSAASSSSPGATAPVSAIFPSALTKVVSSSLTAGFKKLGIASTDEIIKNLKQQQQPISSPSSLADLPTDTLHPPPPQLTPQETAQLMEENHHLLDSLEDQLDQIRRAESRMAEISSLVALFSSKVVEQEEQINTIYDHAIQSTIHVHSGIGQLKKAAQRGVTFRMMILFMILMLSFSLLFLDWFMP